MEYVPTYWIRAGHVHRALPMDMRELYQPQNQRLNQFLRKFNYYFDTKVTPKGAEVRVREGASHPKKGIADERYGDSLKEENARLAAVAADAEDRTALGRLRRLVPKDLTTMSDLVGTLPKDLAQDPEISTRPGGLQALLEEYPQYFQLIDGGVRLRPFGVAPNSLGECTLASSPLPSLTEKLNQLVPSSAESTIPTATLFAALDAGEKAAVKKKYRSFPRFLRLHGRSLMVAQDNLSVRRFVEDAPPPDVESAIAAATGEEVIDGLKLPSAETATTTAETALRELFEALPVAQAAELDDVLLMLPPALRDALQPDVVETLSLYPSYFETWSYPDDRAVVVVQRAKLGTPEVTHEALVQAVIPLIPQGGIPIDRLLRRVPLHIQRFFYRHGVKQTLKQLEQFFVVAGSKVLKLC